MPNPKRPLTDDALAIFRAGIEAVKPEHLVREALILDGDRLWVKDLRVNLRDYRKIIVLGTGKTTAHMCRTLEEILGNRITAGAVTVRRGESLACERIRVFEAGHPIPDEGTLEGTRNVLALADAVRSDDLVICLLSGGGSALLEAIPEGLTLSDLQETSRQLLASGATIHEMNIVRRHLSLVKGGQLARRFAPARCITLVISDVPGDLLESVASGPTAPDPFTFAIARKVVQSYGLERTLPRNVVRYLEEGMEGNHPETVKPGDPVLKNVTHLVIGNNGRALEGALARAQELGYHAEIRSRTMHGEARMAGKRVAQMAIDARRTDGAAHFPACVLIGGETTVTVRGDGRGGRNQELALAAAGALWNTEGDFLVASIGTDGIDGSTEAAGGVVTPEVIQRAKSLNLDPSAFLDRNDSYGFLKQAGGLVVTGPTGTNVMDVVIALVP
jgi:glycerate-2-kinase